MFCWFSTAVLPDPSAARIWRSCAWIIQNLLSAKRRLSSSVRKMPKPLRTIGAIHNLPFIGLPDPKASVLKRFGQEIKLFKLGRMPAQVIVDKAGIARFVHYGHSMSDIPKNSELLEILDQLNARSVLYIKIFSKN